MSSIKVLVKQVGPFRTITGPDGSESKAVVVTFAQAEGSHPLVSGHFQAFFPAAEAKKDGDKPAAINMGDAFILKLEPSQ